MKRWMLMSALALALAACSDEETKPSGEPSNPTCTVDETAVCEGKCGTITVKDSCDADVEVDCGDTCGDTESCNAETNTCEADAPACTVDETAACEGKCGTITVKDSCDADVEVDCGDNCGDGKSCNTLTNACAANVQDECFFSEECADDEFCDSTNCVDFFCYCAVGERGTKACGETIETDARECASGITTGDENNICGCPCTEDNSCPTGMTCTMYGCLM